jgi:hypothetical protein
MWRSLGLTVLCGTITGTMLTLLIIPTAYYLMDNPRQSFKGMLRNFMFVEKIADKISGPGINKIRDIAVKKGNVAAGEGVLAGKENLPRPAVPKMKI